MKKMLDLKFLFILILIVFVFSIALADNYCPNCGAPHKEGEKFCPNCGYKFGEPPSEPTAIHTPSLPPPTQGNIGNLVITGQEPYQGPVGTLVKLTGKGFDPSNPNIYRVEFNGILAKVISVAQDSLCAMVPEGATNGTINVYVNGAPVMNFASYFTVTGNSGSSPGPTPMATPVNLIPTVQITSPTPVIPSGPTSIPTPVSPQYNVSNLPAGKISMGKIVYSAWEKNKYQDDIYVLKAGAGAVDMTNDKYYNAKPCWSPDGNNIAFTSTREGNKEIYSMTCDGKNIKNLTRNPFWDDDPAWSPDGKKIAFDSWRDGNLEIYLMNTDGSGQINLTKHAKDDVLPSWSPDCSKIAFASNRDQSYVIYVMKSDGSSPARLTNPGPSVVDTYPAWSPDGKKIAFQTNRDHNDEIYVMNPDGANQKSLTNNPASDDRAPCWSPDGTKIAFMSNRSTSGEDTYWEICVMSSDGTNMINITNNSYWDGFPNWVK